MAESFRLVLPLPPPQCRPNFRTLDPKYQSAIKSRWRETCRRHVLAALGGRRPKWTQARLDIRYYFRDRRMWDEDNCVASLKQAIDSLKGLVIVDDRTLAVGRPERLVDRDNPRVELTVSEIETHA